jgi:3-oxoacyl-[acyl-carrier-protein] synthase II
MKLNIAITGIGSLSAIGDSSKDLWEEYRSENSALQLQKIGSEKNWVGCLKDTTKAHLHSLILSEPKYKALDSSVHYAIWCAREAVAMAGWDASDNFGINIGSSRGATQLFEKHLQYYLQHGKAKTLASPTTTLGNIASWVAHDLKTKGPEISHSITCSTALHALLNGVVWLESGMVNKFVVGGSEAPLTSFTIAQMKALKIYAAATQETYPCKPLNFNKNCNTMALGEGASVICIEKHIGQKALAKITGIGYATEVLEHNISISTEATCFQDSMKMALGASNMAEVDVIVMHAPGTLKGDKSEYAAIKKIFGEHMPMLTSNKWKLGHTFGASGMLSLELALLMLKHQHFIGVPETEFKSKALKINKILVNAVGFGGNAVSILLEK